MRITRLIASDAARYRQLMLEAYAVASDAFTSTAEERAAEPESFWTKRIADPSGMSAAFGAFDGEDLVGTVALEFSKKPKTCHKALLIGMYVKPDQRRSGFGRALLSFSIEHVQQKKAILQVVLTATEGNQPAISLYESVGFRTFGVEPRAIFTAEGYKAKVHMWLPLQHYAPAA